MSEKNVDDNADTFEEETVIPTSYDGVRLGSFLETGHIRKISDYCVRLDIQPALTNKAVVEIFKESELFVVALRDVLKKKGNSAFDQRTDPASCEQYFQFYGYLSQQQNMMQDYIRTSTYQRAMIENSADFADKVVLDVGAGSGILSFFAIQAGARKVYAVEASSMAEHCQCLVDNNMLADQIAVISGKIEDVELPEMVDIIVSEPMGYMLFNERMLETFIHAKKWLKPRGMMYPSQGDLHIAPFTDEALHLEIYSKANFWQHLTFFGVDLSSLRESAMAEYFRQPIVDTFDYRMCIAQTHRHTVDFVTALESDLHDIDVPLSFEVQQTAMVHGLALWFDVAFNGSQSVVWLSTAPTQPLTHWYQVRCLVQKPVFARQGETLLGRLHLKSNSKQSYDVEVELYVEGREHLKSMNNLDLKNPCFKYGGQPVSAPPGCNRLSPTDAYYDQIDPTTDLNSMDQQQDVSVTPHTNCYPGFGSIVQPVAAPTGPLLKSARAPEGVDLTYINPGSIPVAMVLPSRHQGLFDNKFMVSESNRNLLAPGTSAVSASLGVSSFPLSNSLMIGDYVVPSNLDILRAPPNSGLM